MLGQPPSICGICQQIFPGICIAIVKGKRNQGFTSEAQRRYCYRIKIESTYFQILAFAIDVLMHIAGLRERRYKKWPLKFERPWMTTFLKYFFCASVLCKDCSHSAF